MAFLFLVSCLHNLAGRIPDLNIVFIQCDHDEVRLACWDLAHALDGGVTLLRRGAEETECVLASADLFVCMSRMARLPNIVATAKELGRPYLHGLMFPDGCEDPAEFLPGGDTARFAEAIVEALRASSAYRHASVAAVRD